MTDETQETSWKDTLPEDLQALPMLEKFKSVEDLVRSHESAERMIGKSIRVPGDDAGQDQWDEFLQRINKVDGIARVPKDPDDEGWRDVYRKAGLPEAPTEYGLADEDLAKTLHEAGLTKKQAKRVADLMNDGKVAADEARQEETRNAIAKLKERWGEGFERNSLMARQVVDMLAQKMGAPDQFRTTLNDSKYGNDPFLIEMFAAVGKMLGEPGAPKAGEGVRFGLSPAEAKEQISEIMANKDHPYHDGDRAALDKVAKLYELAYGTEGIERTYVAA